ncbi:FAD dependent oxidoreductase [Lentithecium fluviatile CBS 122367]|uniref:FAD dependent oxidoreductase n=1 Tax=Lentithecium fluviatile CBS 122367 TaxID=1168545 RepID=A0A6G1J5J7_9PLEO|nr:FAD dependent oxidoreductase [Lentithecium fluviatile CBS 122367]
MPTSKSSPIAIIGGGAFGLSTALELSNRGYTDVSVFEKDETIPSRWSAANDLNKIMRAEYEDGFYTDLAVEAMQAWQTPRFAPYFHRVGYLNCVSEAAPQKAIDTMRRFQTAAKKHAAMKSFVSTVDGRSEIQQLCWQFNGALPGWKGYFNGYDGYVHSTNALRSIYRVASANGVRFFLGEKVGAVSEIVYEGTSQSKKSIGVRAKGGRFHAASLVIVAVGAAATTLVPEIGSHVSAKSWSVAHVHLTDDETSALRGIPVTYARDLGFFFEPDPSTNLLKLCPMGGGYINTNRSTGISQPTEQLAESRKMPPGDEKKVRELLRQTLPYLADRPLVEKSLCWVADTDNSDFIIDYVPETSSSVILLSGDSGHGFKMFPIVGRWVNDLLSAADGKQRIARWRWRSGKPARSNAGQEDVSWRVGDVKELRDIQSKLVATKL